MSTVMDSLLDFLGISQDFDISGMLDVELERGRPWLRKDMEEAVEEQIEEQAE